MSACPACLHSLISPRVLNSSTWQWMAPKLQLFRLHQLECLQAWNIRAAETLKTEMKFFWKISEEAIFSSEMVRSWSTERCITWHRRLNGPWQNVPIQTHPSNNSMDTVQLVYPICTKQMRTRMECHKLMAFVLLVSFDHFQTFLCHY